MADDKNNIANVPTATLENEYIAALVDEIERLRRLGDTMAHFVRAGDGTEMFAAVHAWLEARRG